MREKGLKATGCNSAIRAINAYLKWSGSPLKIPQLKEPQLILPTFTATQVSRLVTWKPKSAGRGGRYQRRLHLLVLFLLDTGCRISEALTLRVNEIDFDNLLVTLDGKGRKQRVVPFSFELRKVMFRYVADYGRKPDLLLLASRNETRLGRRVMLRDVKLLCKRLGFTPPARTLHAFRHTFAVNYLRRGGSVFHLQKVLGHSSLEMTRRYANMSTEDLQAVHERVSLLSR
jgi:integrase/recombinase XerD